MKFLDRILADQTHFPSLSNLRAIKFNRFFPLFFLLDFYPLGFRILFLSLYRNVLIFFFCQFVFVLWQMVRFSISPCQNFRSIILFLSFKPLNHSTYIYFNDLDILLKMRPSFRWSKRGIVFITRPIAKSRVPYEV